MLETDKNPCLPLYHLKEQVVVTTMLSEDAFTPDLFGSVHIVQAVVKVAIKTE